MNEKLRALPSVNALLGEADALVNQHGSTVVIAAARRELEAMRAEILRGLLVEAGSALHRLEERLECESRPVLGRAVNATGIVLHTGLGRAVMPPAAATALSGTTGCCNLQMDMSSGARIKREHNMRGLIRELTGAEDALVVNNNAGATLLVLRALAQGREAVVSRGELIEIGGSFRLPEIMEQSGAILKEVGATNKTHLRDYENALSAETAMLLKAHKSNYQIVGFTQEVAISDIASVGRAHAIPVVDDLGCGALIGLERFGLAHEMTIGESLRAGADIVLASTDKLIGGPQGGLIVGKAEFVQKIRSCPLYRALRVGKMTLAALEATLRVFRAPERLAAEHPVYAMIARTTEIMHQQAERLTEQIRGEQPGWQVDVVEEKSYLGGGSLPGTHMPAFAVRITSADAPAKRIALGLRSAPIPVVPHIENNAVLLNMRTIFENEIADIVAACSVEASPDA